MTRGRGGDGAAFSTTSGCGGRRINAAKPEGRSHAVGSPSSGTPTIGPSTEHAPAVTVLYAVAIAMITVVPMRVTTDRLTRVNVVPLASVAPASPRRTEFTHRAAASVTRLAISAVHAMRRPLYWWGAPRRFIERLLFLFVMPSSATAITYGLSFS